jgi:hypothetical protein
MRRRRSVEVFSLSFLDLISGALGAVIIMYVAVPKAKEKTIEIVAPAATVSLSDYQDLEKKVSLLEKINQEQALQAEELKTAFDKLSMVKTLEAPEPDSSYDVGFKFKGKKIVFVIDISRSMLQEDRIGQIKAGLKMLLTGMPPSYQVDLVIFPNGEAAPFKPFWKELKPMTLTHKSQLFDFLYSLKPDGATPTREVLTYALNHYPDLSDVILLTDGEPSLHNSLIKDDIYDLLTHVMRQNEKKVQISTIGVGGEILKDQTSAPYQFLKLLSEQNQGFFVGF